ncbi:MAG: alginate export family protein [Candidatus Omnitrophota bacterium]
MSKRLSLVLALLFTIGTTFAYAEVQNIKVSGDILASGVTRSHFGLIAATSGDKSALKQSFIMSQIRLRVDADLTDNVMATVRLINERIWNGQNDTTSSGNSNIDLDLAYVTLKEFLYSPLSFTVGRQEIRFGNGLVMGNAKADISGTSTIPTDLSERKAFDAIRATLNYDPLVIDLVYAKVKQATSVDRNTIGLAGVNATYAVNKDTNVSAYYFLKRDNYKGTSLGRGEPDQLNTIGGLVTSTPIENLTVSGEAAYQFGRNDSSNTTQKKHDAWAFQAMADYIFAKVKTTPKIGASWTYLSGGKASGTDATRNQGWDAMFYDQKLNNIVYAILPFTNMNAFNLKASCKPLDDVTVSAVYGYYNVAKQSTAAVISPFYYDGSAQYLNTNYTGKTHLGDAIDLTATYDYTEDVQLGLTYGWFKPGNALATNEKDANQLIGSLKVIF